MKFILLNITLALFMSFILISCSELKDDVSGQSNELSYHGPGILNPSAPDFHGNLIKNNHWSMQPCKQCHAANYTGGIAKVSCRTCHTGENGPESCNTCHGNFNDPSRIAPPRGVNGDTSNSYRGVGAHPNHLYVNALGNRVRCGSCHNFPQSVYAPGHLDSDLPAEVNLKGLSIFSGAANASYDPNTLTCANTYCHGNFEFSKDTAVVENQFAYIEDKIVGNKASVVWNSSLDGSQIQCGSCHGLPPVGHLQVPVNQCAACHGEVVDENLNIIDKTKHINGEINVRTNKNKD
ncbi:MAG TPA: CxxxxCH/CxxCH domain-containing protein [Ignavibacteriaceae bacterium]|nr:CxxxxCH/CxxCH domain-containing protein [Ignavibacteriaceae bacterium]